jgi:hypothetical protein
MVAVNGSKSGTLHFTVALLYDVMQVGGGCQRSFGIKEFCTREDS